MVIGATCGPLQRREIGSGRRPGRRGGDTADPLKGANGRGQDRAFASQGLARLLRQSGASLPGRKQRQPAGRSRATGTLDPTGAEPQEWAGLAFPLCSDSLLTAPGGAGQRPARGSRGLRRSLRRQRRGPRGGGYALPALQGEGGVIGPGLRPVGGCRRRLHGGGRRGHALGSGNRRSGGGGVFNGGRAPGGGGRGRAGSGAEAGAPGWGRQGTGRGVAGWAAGDRLQAAARRGHRGARLGVVAPSRGGRHRWGSGPGIARTLRPTGLGRSGAGRADRPAAAPPGGLLPGLPPVLVGVVLEQPVEALLHPAAEPGRIETSRPQAPMAQTAALGARQPRTGSGASHAIHQLPAPAHPAVEALLQRFRHAAPGATAIPRGAPSAVPGGSAATRRLPERSRATGQPQGGTVGFLLGTAVRQPIPTIPGLIHAFRLPAAARQPALPAQPQQGDRDPSPLQGPEKGGHGRHAVGRP